MTTKVRQWLGAAADVLLPRLCPVCGRVLGSDEPHLCRACLSAMPRTRLEQQPLNAMEQLFAGLVPIERATGYFYYEKASPYAAILHDIKYRNRPDMGQWLACHAARQIAPSGFWDGVDAIVPVPLHVSKLAKRGYNQSMYLARGVSQATGMPVVEAVEAVRAHATQTHRGALDRWKNTREMYAAHASAKQLAGRHVVVVDDVVTTGATLEACATALQDAVPGIKVSLFALAVARID